MRTTLDIDDDVLQAAKELAQARKKTTGKVLSDLARQALEPKTSYKVRNGVPVIPHRPGAPLMTTTGDFSANAPAMELQRLSPPTQYVTQTAPIPLIRAYPSAAYPAQSSRVQPITRIGLSSNIP